MVNRRVGKSARFAKKKKLKISDNLRSPSAHYDQNGLDMNTNLRKPSAAMKKKLAKKASSRRPVAMSAARRRSQILKAQAVERMALKEHIVSLRDRRARIRKGEDAKVQRRELGKFIKQLIAEQDKKHKEELGSVNGELQSHLKREVLRDVATVSDAIPEGELRNMFAHLLQA